MAWLAVAGMVAAQVHTEVRNGRHSPWQQLPWSRWRAVVKLAVGLHIGSLLSRTEGGEERIIGQTVFGIGDGWVTTSGDPSPIVTEIWARAGGLRVEQEADRTLALQPDAREPEPPSARVREMAADQEALWSRGSPVGLLIDGPPGSGKSQALLHCAHRLGGRTLRASLGAVSPSDVVGIAMTLGATAVILDDVDRGPTSEALDAIERLVGAGVAVLASSNDQGEICEALLRDGRIDDHRSLGAIEPDVLANLAGGLDHETTERLSKCTVASVVRYLHRREAWGPERAMAALRPMC